MANKQTAIDWLMEQYDKSFGPSFSLILNDEIKRAKAMHKEEIVKAVHFGINQWGGWDSLNGEQYYNETYGGNNEQKK